MNRHLSPLVLAVLALASTLAAAQDAASAAAQAQVQAQVQAKVQAQAQARAQAEEARAMAREQADAARVQAQEARAQAQQARAQARQGAAQAAAQQAGEGKVYAPGAFDSVEVDGSGQVRLVQGERDEVFVPGGERAQDDVDIRLVGSRMKIDLPGSWKFWNNGSGAQVEVRVRHLARLTLSGSNDVLAPGPINSDQLTVSMAGSGLVRFDQLQVGRLNFDVSGAGEGQLAGKVDQLRLSVSGKGKIGAEQLRAGSADVSISGVGNAQLWAANDLRVQISGAGHIEYWGQPTVHKSISGFGSVDARGDKQ
jgi:multidrug efflux pump subunit AcrA (membrane-fusion protein)